EVDGARTAQRLAAAVLRAGEADEIAQHPEQRHRRIRVDLVLLSVDRELHGATSPCGHAAPVWIHAAASAPSSACVPMAGLRSAPGAQPHATSGSCARWSWICASDLPPLRAPSLICSQICADDLSSHTIVSGARCQSGAPGT